MKKLGKALLPGIGLPAIVIFLIAIWIKLNTAATYNTNIAKAPFDAIIVPGIPYDTALKSKAVILFKSRMMWSKYLYEKGYAKNIIYSGAAVHTPYQEGAVMKMIAEAWGIPAQNTFVEGNALHSIENVIYGLQLADSLGFKHVAVATDPFQSLLLQKQTKQEKIYIALLPMSMKLIQFYSQVTLPKIDAERALVKNFVPLKYRAKTARNL